MQIPKSIILSFALQASFVLDIGARRLSGKSPKSPKQPKSVCLEKGSLYEIEPDFEGVFTPQRFYDDCCAEYWAQYPITDWASDPLAAYTACRTDLAANADFKDCENGYELSYPFKHYVNYAIGVEFNFANIIDDPILGDTAFRGAISSDAGPEKVILQYLSTPPYEEDENSLAGRSLADLEYIEYSFKALACHGTDTECPEQFYLNVYAKADPPRSTSWFDCAFHFTPSIGGAENGDWTTIRFDRDSVSDPGSRCGSGGTAGDNACSDCPATGTSWGAVADLDVGYEMGASGNNILIFALNMGDTSTSAAGLDTGLEGLYDRVVIKLHGEEARVYDL